MKLRVGIIGYGVIARKQHLPAIRAGSQFELAGIANLQPVDDDPGCRIYADAAEMIADPAIDAISLCTPPGVRHAHAAAAFAAGKHVMLEKPPAATLGEATAMAALAEGAERTLFASWHSQANAAVERARDLLAGESIRSLHVTWKESVLRYHPGQRWIWEPGGFGVFDAGINALSILSRILPEPLVVTGGELGLGPGGQTPIAALIRGRIGDGEVVLDFDWRTDEPLREIRIVTTAGRTIFMPESGRHLHLDGVVEIEGVFDEYPKLYALFAELIAAGQSQVDLEPLRIVADCFLAATRVSVPLPDGLEA